MHSRCLLLSLFCLATSFCWAGGAINIVTVDNEFPGVGQTVTFTLDQFESKCGYGSPCIIPANGTPCIPIAINGTATYSYISPGTYTVELHCSAPPPGADPQKEVTNKVGSALPLILRNASGATISGNLVSVSAASTNASAIPTLGEWGLIILGIIILGIGLVSMRQKRVLLSTIEK